jgi:tetratricopeptide (TPR) repeat protein
MKPKTSATGSSLILATAVLGLLLRPSASPAATPCDPPIARMVSVQGDVEVRRAGQTQSQPARLNDTYCPGDRIQVGDRSRADVALVNEPVLRLDQNTTITLGGVKEERTSLIDLARGAVHFFSRLPRGLEVNTAFVNAGVEGTEGLVRVETDRTLIIIFEGRVLAANQAGSLPITSGQAAIAEKGKPPVLTVVVRPRDAVQWALYYPPVAYFRAQDFQGPEPWREMVRKSLDAYMKGDYQAAFEAIKGVPSDIREPRFFAYRAQLLLGVGRVDEASKDVQQALSLNPNYSDALALQSVIAVVQNDKERALDVAKKAVAADPKSTTALTALSYAQQANFDIEGALQSLQQAVQINPNDALAWARLSEVHLMFARINEALEAAQKAVALDPNISRTQTVLGFAYLTRVNTTESKTAFEKAIALDQADYLARLGLGLAKIREGDLQEGGREIEVAASLNPNNSIVRSYLGKTYYEEKRIGLDSREYSIAKELDPKDPTPWFYDSIAKQTTNRPVEALQDMEKAIELNDNRAVYRSQLLLDSDLAARSAALGRIYSDLGFQQLALVEGWKSVNTDPSNFSAHRFLADSYSVLPRHEIARVSELLQSQLLQPINITPIQPALAESNLFLLSSQGPGTTSFLEFNPLFNRNQIAFQTSALGGQHDTFAGEGIVSGIYNKASFSLGGSHFQTDGWRTNSDQHDSIGDAFLQLELAPEASVQFEYRYRDRVNGDLQQRFFPEDFFPKLTDRETRNTYRLGGRYAFTPNSILLASYQYSKADTHQRDNQPPINVGPLTPFLSFVDFSNPPIDAFSGEVQHQFRSRYFNLTSGLGYFKINGAVTTTLGFDFPPPPFGPGPQAIPVAKTNIGLHHVNGYAYGYINAIRNLTITLGYSFDLLGGDSGFVPGGNKNQYNPKFGITWNPLPDTTLRAAAFRVLKRTLITDQTLEPTQVAGFNQFFDDVNATSAWNYGVAVDQKFTKNLFGGTEFSFRDLNIPQILVGNRTIELSGKEYLARTYLFWTPHPWWALRGQYIFERFTNDQVINQPFQLNTYRLPLGVSFFHPSGFGAALTTTYWYQNGEFQRVAKGVNGARQSGQDDFWTVDAAINYRLPKRYGFITVGVTNLFNQSFKFFNTDINNPYIQPSRTVFGKITLAFP